MKRLLLLCCALYISAAHAQAEIAPATSAAQEVFHEDFSRDLSLWVGKEGDGSVAIKSEIVPDTLRAGRMAIRSKEKVVGGDFFTKRAFAPGTYTLTLDYLGRCPTNCGGVVGIGSDFPGTTRWLAATDLAHSGATTQLVDSGKWQAVSISFNAKSEFHLIFEHWQLSKGEPGQVMFSNMKLVAEPPPLPQALTKEDLTAFLDGIVPDQLKHNDVAGAVVSVVKDGEVLLSKGYGYADVAAKKPASADATLFRIGSVSKLFTWTAVMQLVEQGKINLDVDVNQYLDFHIPDAFGKPVTMRNLMTHTAGFEETFQDMMLADAKHLQPAGKHLASHIPARIFAPGTVGAYSNYGAALAGYIVERQSGESFDNYIQRHITGPLGMEHSSFAQPLPTALASMMSNGYMTASAAPNRSKSFRLLRQEPCRQRRPT